MGSVIKNLTLRIFRRKKFTVNGHGEIVDSHSGPKLLRVLGLFDLTFLGIGSTLGVGIYVLAGSVAKDIAGPAVCLSFLIAAIASAISGLCYAEFGARVPKAGSAYIYSYVTVGELVAFVIGWNLILEYLIGASSVARALSSNVDTIINHSMSDLFIKITPINVPQMSPYADWFSFGIGIFMTMVLALGVKSSSMLTNIFTVMNLVVVFFVMTAGIGNVNLENWNLHSNVTTAIPGNGGFMPYGLSGVMTGAAKCFFGFVGFDSIAAAGEEAKDPKRNVPLSIMLTLVAVLLAYVGISTVLTLMIPYYLQDKVTPLVYAFQTVGQSWAAIIVTAGSIFGLTASLLGSMIPMPRIVYAMAKDGLLFHFLAAVHPKFKTPFAATLLTGFTAAVVAMLTELDALVDMMSIGTLLAYTLVAVSILIVRYEFNPRSNGRVVDTSAFTWQRKPTRSSSRKSKLLIIAYCSSAALFCLLSTYFQNLPSSSLTIILLVSTAVLTLSFISYLSFLPRSVECVYFMVPLVPLVPALSIIINIYLMFQLSLLTWLRFIVWMLAGFLIYGCYGLKHSPLESSDLTGSEEDLFPLVSDENLSLN